MKSLNLRFSFHETATARASALQLNLGKPKKGGEALKKITWFSEPKEHLRDEGCKFWRRGSCLQGSKSCNHSPK